MEIPFVKKDEYPLVDLSDDGFLSLMLKDGTLKEDVKLPEGTDEDNSNAIKIREDF